MGGAELKRVAVFAPRDVEEARASLSAILALTASGSREVVVFAADAAGVALAELGVKVTTLEGELTEALEALAPDAVALLDPSPENAEAARAAGVELRAGWGRSLGALTHAVQPAQFEGRDHRPEPERIYLDVVGLLGVLPETAGPLRAPVLPEGRVLLRLPNWLGDAVQCEPLLRAFEESAERLTVVGPRALRGLLSSPLAEATWLPRTADAGSWRGHDLALLLDGSFRSALKAALARIPKRVSWARGGKRVLLTDAQLPPRELGAPAVGCGLPGRGRRWLPRPFEVSVRELASVAGIELEGGAPRLSAGERGRRAAASLLEAAGIGAGDRFVLASVGGRPGSAKAAPLETWREVFDRLRASLEQPVLLTCAPGEDELMQSLAKRGLPRGVSLSSGGAIELDALLGLLESAAAFLTTDSGPRHLAAAVGCPSVVLHGPTDPRHSSLTAAPIRVSRLQVPCGPCHLERCPLQGEDRLACFGAGHAEAAVAMLCELLEARA